MKVMYNNCYCRKLEQHIQLYACKNCKYCVFADKRVYCNYPTNK